MNFEKEGRKLWKLTKQINDDSNSQRQKFTLEDSGKLHSGKQAADKLAESYRKESTITINSCRQRNIRQEINNDKKTQTAQTSCPNYSH